MQLILQTCAYRPSVQPVDTCSSVAQQELQHKVALAELFWSTALQTCVGPVGLYAAPAAALFLWGSMSTASVTIEVAAKLPVPDGLPGLMSLNMYQSCERRTSALWRLKLSASLSQANRGQNNHE
jgi:hypothetical protein